MTLLQLSNESNLQREDVADQLRRLADQLERHNDVEFTLEGVRYSIDVPSEVAFEVELELGDDGNELELEIKW
ncbi:MAG: amphi-Trp domain-containing protein [Ilumatobacter sp.]|uniref:amphi-Trp domain-containing protein n=1 Tax=Ilumatobacter sp. TaxID=1967498 RepID=UPI003C706640